MEVKQRSDTDTHRLGQDSVLLCYDQTGDTGQTKLKYQRGKQIIGGKQTRGRSLLSG